MGLIAVSVAGGLSGCSGIKRGQPAGETGGEPDASAGPLPSWDGGFDLLRPAPSDGGCTTGEAGAGGGGVLPAGCLVVTLCGNGALNGPLETCDDGNVVGGDGCSSSCALETDWICGTPGQPCTSAVSCGDGQIGGRETCDDRNAVSGDGCSADCALEPGWLCALTGARCQPVCGDGKRLGDEGCDDGNLAVGDGCNEACRIESGFACPSGGQPCHLTVCGDHVKEGNESCDDGNGLGGDGCASDCRAEPVCVGTAGCSSPCGDGLKLPDEACDDGNTASGDGCSADCQLEPKWDCRSVGGGGDDSRLIVDVVLRDFMAKAAPNGHPNFENTIGGLCTGMVKPLLADDHTPVMVVPSPACSGLTTAADFAEWYHESTRGKTVPDKLTLLRQTNGAYLFDHSQQWSGSATTGWILPPYFPLDDRGWAAPPAGPERASLPTCSADGLPHNFAFTSVVRYWFSYAGDERLDFIGDDDVWVFVNGQLAVDIGGVHAPVSGTVTLDAAAATRFALTVGHIYEIDVFQAERHTCGSSYKLTLGNFSAQRTVCDPHCGDGVVNGAELCDDGVNDGRYGGCAPGCAALGPTCGDGMVEPGAEECDDGANRSTYGQPGCAAGCRTVPRCGDGKVDGLWGESCDDGNVTKLDGCSDTCQREIL